MSSEKANTRSHGYEVTSENHTVGLDIKTHDPSVFMNSTVVSSGDRKPKNIIIYCIYPVLLCPLKKNKKPNKNSSPLLD